MARPRKPTALKVLEGNPGGRPLPVEPDFDEVADAHAEPPVALGVSARKEWDRVMPILSKSRVMLASDLATLALYCVAYGRVVQCHNKMRNLPPIMDGSAGKINGYESLLIRWSDQMMKYATQFGLTPSSRAKLGIDPPEEMDPVEKYFGKGG